MTTYITPVSDGLGDLLVCFPAIELAIKLYSPVVLVLRSKRQEGAPDLLAGLCAWITEKEFLGLTLGPDDRFINLRDHPLQTSHVWESPEFAAEFPGYHINEIVRHIASDLGLSFDPNSLAAMPHEQRAEALGKIAFVPGTIGAYKHWPTEYWLSLAERLRGEGLDCFVLGQPEHSPAVRELIAAGLCWIASPDLVAAKDLLTSSLAAVCVNTGLMHLAVRQKVPCVVMYTQPPIFLRTEPNCYPVLAPPCAEACMSRLFANANLEPQFAARAEQGQWDCATPGPLSCMNQIDPASVFEQLMKALSARTVVATEI